MQKRQFLHNKNSNSTSASIILIAILSLAMSSIVNCTSGKTGTRKDVIKREYRTSGKSLLNYEDAAAQFTIDNIRSHFLVHIEIEKPYIMKSAQYNVDKIYRISGIEGTAIYRVSLSSTGKVLSYKLIKKAGLGLDTIAGEIIKTMKLYPGYKSAASGKTTVFVRIIFSGKDRI